MLNLTMPLHAVPCNGKTPVNLSECVVLNWTLNVHQYLNVHQNLIHFLTKPEESHLKFLKLH